MSKLHLSDEELQRYLSRELDSQEREKIESHLAACKFCGGRLEEYRSLFAGLKREPEISLPEDFTQKVLTAMEKEKELSFRDNALQMAIYLVLLIFMAGVTVHFTDMRAFSGMLFKWINPEYFAGLSNFINNLISLFIPVKGFVLIVGVVFFFLFLADFFIRNFRKRNIISGHLL